MTASRWSDRHRRGRGWNKRCGLELHVDEAWHGRGIGRRLVDRLAALGAERGLRVMLVDVQNTNANAIAFYYRAGFVLDGIDLSYYSNQDVTQGEVAFFMKRYLT
jgi:ribosomal protein S18 acetylase RimI-like enzyme